jgi:hypothetical protein
MNLYLMVLANIGIERFKKIQKENLLFTINLFCKLWATLCHKKNKKICIYFANEIYSSQNLNQLYIQIEFPLNAFFAS